MASFNHYLKQKLSSELKFDWMATSLNPYYEGNDQFHDALTEDCFIEQTFSNWYFGPHNSGNIQQPNFHRSLNEEFHRRLNRQATNESSNSLWNSPSNGVFSLVTADGGMSSIEEPELQEINAFKLILNEAVVALNCLDNGGSLILKVFGFFNCRTISLIYFLTCLFERVHLFKPISSKEGNSEIYLVCINYQLNKNAKLVEQVTASFEEAKKTANGESDVLLFKKEMIPTDFLARLVECANMFATHQTNAIERNIYFNEIDDRKFYYQYKKLQTKIAQHFNQLIDLKPIRKADQLVNKSLKLDFRKCNYFDGLNEELLMAYGKPNSYAELIADLHRTDKKLALIKQLISSVYSLPKSELFASFNQFHQFNRHSASNILDFENFITQPRSQLNQKPPKYSNTRLACDRLIKVLIDFESVEANDGAMKPKMQTNEQEIVNQFRALLVPKSSVDLQNHIQQNKQASDLSSILRATFESFKVAIGSPAIHVIDLLNLSDEILDDEHCTANQLVTKLTEIVDRLQFDDTLVVALPSLFTRYAFGLVYLCTCLFKRFTISPVYLREFRSGLILVFANENRPTTLQDGQARNELGISFDEAFESERNQVSSLLKQIDHFNRVHRDEQILDFIGIHNLMRTGESTDFIRLIILANNLNLIETLKLRIEH